MAILAVVLRVHVHQRLHPVVASRQLAQACVGIAVRSRVDDHGFARLDVDHVGREERHAAVALPRGVVGGDPGLGVRRRADGQEETASEWTVVDAGGVADFDTEPGGACTQAARIRTVAGPQRYAKGRDTAEIVDPGGGGGLSSTRESAIADQAKSVNRP